MSTVSKDQIAQSIGSIIYKMVKDTGFDEEIRANTWLVADLGLESLDIVVLGTTIQQQFNEIFPFNEFLLDIGRREVRDIRFDEFVAFVENYTNNKPIAEH